MRGEYDITKLKVKRRGVLPALQGQDTKLAKVRITISLDQDVVEYFKAIAENRAHCPTKRRSIKRYARSSSPMGKSMSKN